MVLSPLLSSVTHRTPRISRALMTDSRRDNGSCQASRGSTRAPSGSGCGKYRGRHGRDPSDPLREERRRPHRLPGVRRRATRPRVRPRVRLACRAGVGGAEPSPASSTGLGSFARVIAFDKRGHGAVRPRRQSPASSERMDDVRAVMDAAGSERATMFGDLRGRRRCAWCSPPPIPSGRPPSCSTARSPDSEETIIRSVLSDRATRGRRGPPRGPMGNGVRSALGAQRRDDDAHSRHWWAEFQRLSASPGAAVAFIRTNLARSTSRDVLPTIQVPTLVIHRTGDQMVTVPARPVPGRAHPRRAVGRASRRGPPLVRRRPGRDPGRRSRSSSPASRATASPIACWPRCCSPTSSARRRAPPSSATADGATCSRAWHARVRGLLERYRGREVKTTGDGFLATFDGPARAIHCALGDRDASQHRSASRCAPGCTPVSARSWATTSAASPCTSRRGSWRRPSPARCSCPAP